MEWGTDMPGAQGGRIGRGGCEADVAACGRHRLPVHVDRRPRMHRHVPPKAAKKPDAEPARRVARGTGGKGPARHRSIMRSASEAVMIPTMRALRETSMHFVKRSSGTRTLAGVS